MKISKNNTLIGEYAGFCATTGSNNVCIGEHAGAKITTGSNNICIGKNAGRDITDQDNQVRIGENARLDADEMFIMQEGRVIISKKIMEQLVPDIYERLNENT
jgi:hypothetical protein